MKICFPVQKDEGMKSVLYDHFGSAPMLALVDTDMNSIVVINNPDQHHTGEAWSPIKALGNQKIDAIIVAGIGVGAISGLSQMGIKVYRAQAATVQENIIMLKNQKLPELTPEHRCG